MYTIEHLSAIKNNEMLLCVTSWMELEGIILSEKKKQAEIDKYCIFSFTSGL